MPGVHGSHGVRSVHMGGMQPAQGCACGALGGAGLRVVGAAGPRWRGLRKAWGRGGSWPSASPPRPSWGATDPETVLDWFHSSYSSPRDDSHFHETVNPFLQKAVAGLPRFGGRTARDHAHLSTS